MSIQEQQEEKNKAADWLQSVRWNSATQSLDLLDQRQLPDEIVYLELTTAEQVWDAIKQLAVRGAATNRDRRGVRGLPRRAGYKRQPGAAACRDGQAV